jgi:hypothetical protein
MDQNYWIYEDYFIFKPEFNGSIDNYIDTISNLKILVFSNYNDPKLCIKTNNKYDPYCTDRYTGSKFNQPDIHSL